MTLEMFLTLLSIVSVLTSLCVEAIKNMLYIKIYNIVAAVTSVIISIFVMCTYCIGFSIGLNAKTIVLTIALILMSWLCSQLGFDKVKQAILQLKED